MSTSSAADARTVWDVMRETAHAVDAQLAADRAGTGEAVAAQYARLRAELLAVDPTADPAWTALVHQLPADIDEADAWPRLLAAMRAHIVATTGDDAA